MSDGKARRKIAEDAVSVLYDGETKQLVFADGVGQISLGPHVSKISFFRSVHAEMKGGSLFDEREIVMELVIPTVPLVLMLSSVTDQVKNGIPLLEDGATKGVELLRGFVSRIGK